MERVISFVDLEYTTRFDREGTSTDHEVEGMLPRDRIIERLNTGKNPLSLRHEFWACSHRCQLKQNGCCRGGVRILMVPEKKNYSKGTKANSIAGCERERVF